MTAARRAFPLANTIELVLSSAHLSPQPKRQIGRFSHFCAGHVRVLSGMSFALTNSISITSAGFARLISMTDKPTNRETNRHTDHASSIVVEMTII